jgi:hypothetical protein
MKTSPNSPSSKITPSATAAFCPECAETASALPSTGRREFIRVLTGGAMGIGLAGGSTPLRAAAAESTRAAKPAESLVRELFSTLSAEQKAAVVLPWAQGAESGTPARLKTHNGPPLGKKLGEQFTKPQQDLIRETFRSILSGDEAFDRISRHGKWDNSGTFEGNGIAIFGDPSGKDPFSWVFAGHHLTLRCDGNSQPNTAFGGPMYYGHSANGHSDVNVYNYQTREVMGVFEMLSADQRKQATIVGSPGDGVGALKAKLVEAPPAGVSYAELNESQRTQVTGVMRTLLNPFRKEDGDEVMDLIKAIGGV